MCYDWNIDAQIECMSFFLIVEVIKKLFLSAKKHRQQQQKEIARRSLVNIDKYLNGLDF